jgi:hypothetical protein
MNPIIIPGELTLANVQKAIYSWIKSRTGSLIPNDQIIWRDQSQPLPPRPCITMKIIDGPRRVGYSDSQMFIGGPTGSQFMMGGQREMTISIQIFGNIKIQRPMAYQLAVELNSSLSLPTVIDSLSQAGIGVLNQGDPINITALEETEYEERAQFDVLISVAQNMVDDPGIITTLGPIDYEVEAP